MATQLFLLDASADIHLATDLTNLAGTAVPWRSSALGTNRGSGVVANTGNTVAGPTSGIEVPPLSAVGNEKASWISPPVSADVTISGTITLNIWAAENNMSANVAINAVIEVIRANTLTTRDSNTIVEIARSTRTVECAVTTRAVNNFTVTPTSTVVNRGDRIRVRVFGDDSTANMASGFTFTIGFNGTTGAADGDTYISFTETFSFESAPSGSQLFFRNIHSGLSGEPALVSDFTGTNESPLSEGGNWAALNTSASQLQRISNAASGVGAGDNYSYWTPANFGPDLDAYNVISTIGGGTGIAFRIQGEGGSNTWDGYLAVGSVSNTTIYSVTDGALTQLSQISQAWASGDKFGVRAAGSTIQVWRQASGSSDWNLVLTTVNSTYGSAGKIGIWCSGTSVRVSDFYAATDSNLFTQLVWTTRGPSVLHALATTVTGWIVPRLLGEWYTPQLNSFTLGGMAEAHLRGFESSAAANASLRCEVARVDSDGTNPTVWGSWCISATVNGEINTSDAAYTANVSGDDLAVSDGQRLRIRIYIEDMTNTATQTGHSVDFSFNGVANEIGDSYITLPQTVTEFVVAPGFMFSRRSRSELALLRRRM